MTAVKEALLQVLVVLAPIFAYQIWQEHKGKMESLPFRIGLLCLLSMTLCLLFRFELEEQVWMDLRAIPYMIGTLYGGYGVCLILTVFSLLLRYLWIGGGLDFYLTLGMYAVLVPTIFLIVKPFQAADMKKKISMALGYYLLIMVCTVAAKLVGKEITHSSVSWENMIFLLYFTVISIGCLLLSIYFMEKIQEKWELHSQLRLMSSKYLNESRKLQKLMDATPVTVIAIDKSLRLTALNDAVMTYMKGVSKADLIGQPYSRFTEPYNIDYTDTALYKALYGEETHSQILQYNDLTFLVNAYSIKNIETEEVEGAVCLTLELTELQQLRKEISAMERLSLVGQMAASITHEIRNPMAVIRGFVQLMREKGGQPAPEYFQVILEELDRANGIIDDFLSLAQNRIIEKRMCRVEQIIVDLEPLILAEANLRGIELRLQLADDSPLIELNDKEIKQLLLNLVRNGMDAMEEKGVLTLATDAAASAVRLRISDTGSGIPKDQITRLFEPFYTTKKNGTGLGLAVCLSIMERHHGTIEVESEEGAGSTFVLSFRTNPQ